MAGAASGAVLWRELRSIWDRIATSTRSTYCRVLRIIVSGLGCEALKEHYCLSFFSQILTKTPEPPSFVHDMARENRIPAFAAQLTIIIKDVQCYSTYYDSSLAELKLAEAGERYLASSGRVRLSFIILWKVNYPPSPPT